MRGHTHYPGRHGVVATDFFEGYEGYLHADGYVVSVTNQLAIPIFHANDI